MAENILKVGQLVKFDDEKRHNWRVRAVRENFAILTANFFGCYYTIVDFELNIRGPDNCYGIGYETQEQIDNAMKALFGDCLDECHIEVSHRRKKKLNITGIKDR